MLQLSHAHFPHIVTALLQLLCAQLQLLLITCC
jgi:hypothetical protein